MVSKKVNVYNGLRTMRHEILCNFCYLFNNLILHKPFKNKDLYDTMVDTLKHLQVHTIPYKYCYLNASKSGYIVIFLTIYLKGEGVLFTSHKNTTTATRGGTYKLWNFCMPRSDTWRYINQKLFSNLVAGRKKERPFLIPLHSYLMNRTLMIQLFHLLL